MKALEMKEYLCNGNHKCNGGCETRAKTQPLYCHSDCDDCGLTVDADWNEVFELPSCEKCPAQEFANSYM